MTLLRDELADIEDIQRKRTKIPRAMQDDRTVFL